MRLSFSDTVSNLFEYDSLSAYLCFRFPSSLKWVGFERSDTHTAHFNFHLSEALLSKPKQIQAPFLYFPSLNLPWYIRWVFLKIPEGKQEEK